MSERASDGVSSEVKPLGAVELLAVQAHARYFAFHGPDHTFTSKGAAAEMLRLCATIRQLEGGLAAVTAERDAAMLFVSRWLDGAKPRHEAERIREMLARRGYSQMHAAEMAGIATALEALPEEIPGVADVIEALYARKAKEETEG